MHDPFELSELKGIIGWENIHLLLATHDFWKEPESHLAMWMSSALWLMWNWRQFSYLAVITILFCQKQLSSPDTKEDRFSRTWFYHHFAKDIPSIDMTTCRKEHVCYDFFSPISHVTLIHTFLKPSEIICSNLLPPKMPEFC